MPKLEKKNNPVIKNIDTEIAGFPIKGPKEPPFLKPEEWISLACWVVPILILIAVVLITK